MTETVPHTAIPCSNVDDSVNRVRWQHVHHTAHTLMLVDHEDRTIGNVRTVLWFLCVGHEDDKMDAGNEAKGTIRIITKRFYDFPKATLRNKIRIRNEIIGRKFTQARRELNSVIRLWVEIRSAGAWTTIARRSKDCPPKRISMSASGDAVMCLLAQWMSIVESVGKSASRTKDECNSVREQLLSKQNALIDLPINKARTVEATARRRT